MTGQTERLRSMCNSLMTLRRLRLSVLAGPRRGAVRGSGRVMYADEFFAEHSYDLVALG